MYVATVPRALGHSATDKDVDRSAATAPARAVKYTASTAANSCQLLAAAGSGWWRDGFRAPVICIRLGVRHRGS